jgi:prephenate dehydrogenase
MIAIVGFGRFGRALASLLDDAAMPWTASSVEGASIVVIAVPVPSIGAAVSELHLTPDQLVVDVGSVKVGPVAAMKEALGGRVPWVGSHPLFGPMSLALAERPLRVVVCPNPLHPDAARRATEFYESIGCEVVLQSPEEHDRVMAHTHALTFFVAKGMIDAGAGLDVPFAPPSFQAFARTIETVRSDAGHLFAAIQRENPFAKDARKHLLEAMTAIDRAIGEQQDAGLAIPAAPEAPSPELADAREAIDGLDRAIVALLARRTELARRAAKAKAQLGRPVLDSAREGKVKEARRAWAREVDLDEEGIAEVFRAIMTLSRRAQSGVT